MRRREFLAWFGGLVAANWSVTLPAQEAGRTMRIGVLQPQDERDQEAQSWLKAFRDELNALGWSEGRNVRMDIRWAGGDLDRFRSYAAELVGLNPDVLFGMSTPTVTALRKATRSVPIVFANANDPVGRGFVESLARPGGNITGFVAFEPAMGGKWVEMLREIAPKVERVALIYNPTTHTGQYFESVDAAALSLRIKAIRAPFRSADELQRVLENFARERNGGVIVLPDASTRVHRDLIVKLTARHLLPAVYSYRLFIPIGGLAYYGTSTTEQFRKAAEYVDRILRGSRPADLPVQAPVKFEFVLNHKTAKALGLEVPASLLARADEVVE